MFDGIWYVEYETQRRSWSFNVLMFCRQLDFRHNINKHSFLQYPIRKASNIAYMSVQMWIYRITKWPVPYLHVNGDCKDVKRMPLPHWHDTGIAKILPSVMNICSSATQAWNSAMPGVECKCEPVTAECGDMLICDWQYWHRYSTHNVHCIEH